MTRPEGFDAALVAYLPSLQRQARFMSKDRPDDLLQDAVTDMLHLSDRCRVSTFRTWAQIILRRSASNHIRRQRAEKRTARHVELDRWIDASSRPSRMTPVECRVAPPQIEAVALSEVLAALSTIQDGEAVLREAMGDTLTDMGRERGISREAMRQRRERAKLRLSDRFGVAA